MPSFFSRKNPSSSKASAPNSPAEPASPATTRLSASAGTSDDAHALAHAHASASASDRDRDRAQQQSVRTPSPIKKSYTSYFAKERDRKEKKERPSPRSSKSFQRDKTSRRGSDTHPLNLPPDELRRLSALSAMSSPREREREKEKERDIVGNRDSREGGVSLPESASDPMEETTPAPETPPTVNSTPGAFPSGANGVNGDKHDDDNDQRPTPPPHRTPASPPPQPEARPEDAERFKAEGNKYYKAGKYAAAIDEYSKGSCFECVSENCIC